jgi:hypothetical protein
MRRAIFALAIALAACHRAETFEAKPPRSLPDRMTAIKNESPALFAKPAPWMLGCYHVAGKDPLLPTELELTSEPRKESEIQPRYITRLQGRFAQEFGRLTWIPTNDGVQISMSTGFVGWFLDVQKSPEGFRGTAQWFTDAGEHRDVPVVLTRVACR